MKIISKGKIVIKDFTPEQLEWLGHVANMIVELREEKNAQNGS